MLRIVNFGSSKGGLATIGYTIYGANGVAIGSRITSGVVEVGTSTGIYAANITMPGYDAIILWDTGEATPRYSTEDYQHQIDAIAEGVELIQKIYNSIRNQGEFFALFMDRLGLIEKNTDFKQINDKLDGLAKKNTVPLTDMEEAFKKSAKEISLTALAPEVKLPPINIPEIKIPDYTNLIGELKNMLLNIRGEIMKVPKTQKEYSGNFSNLISLLNSFEQKISNVVSEKSTEMVREVKSMRTVFVKFDTLLEKINILHEKLNSLDTNDKEIIKTKQEIMNDIKRLNQFLYDFVSSPYMKEAKDNMNILMAFGHKR